MIKENVKETVLIQSELELASTNFENTIKYWDELHSVPIIRANEIESSWPLYEGEKFRMRVGIDPVSHNNLPIDALFIPGEENSTRLIVTFHGAIKRPDIQIPRFEWIGQLGHRKEHKLFIADTTLELSDKLNLAWYIGTPEFNLIEHIQSFIRHVKNVNNIKEIVLMGSSGGGFAALSVGAKLENTCSLAYSPQTDIWDFTDGHSEALIDVIFSGKDVSSTKKDISNRTDLFSAYKNGRHLNSYIYYQNLGDKEHLEKHWKRFANSQGVRLKNGRSFNQQGLFISDLDGEGHVRPPVSRTDELIDRAFSLASSTPPLLIEDSKESGDIQALTFNIASWELETVPVTWLMYSFEYKFTLSPENENLAYNDNGVPLKIISGTSYEHPVLQAQTGLKLLNNILNSNDKDTAINQVESIIIHLKEYAIQQNGALFFPYTFSWHQNDLQPPWYSAMAQGQVLQLVCRFIELTGKDEYIQLADSIFKSFTSISLKNTDNICVVHIDSEKYLWLEEYPYPDYNKFVLNGHIFASLGVYEYWRLTNDQLAKKVFLGATTTVKRYINDFRNPSWSSSYDLYSKLLIRNYHQTHIMLLESLYRVIGDNFFSRIADTFDKDFPHYQRHSSVYFSKGTHIGYKADNSRVPTMLMEEKPFNLDKSIAIPSTVRTKIETEDGIWLYFEDDTIFAGYWFKEVPKKVFPKLCLDRRNYPRPRRFIPKSSTITINGFNQYASPIDTMQLEIEQGSSIAVISKALWNGEEYILLDTVHPGTQSWHLYSNGEGVLV